MAITHTTLMNNVQVGSNDVAKVIAVYNAILSAYTWEAGSEVYNIDNISAIYGKYYFTANSYIKISNYTPHNYGVKIEIVTPNSTKTISLQDPYYMFSVGKTSKGICICAYSSADTSRNPCFYNIYIGEIIKLDGTVIKGCVYVADESDLTIITDEGVFEEIAQTSTISTDRNSILIPIVNTTNGDRFKDIYLMRYSPIQYNIMNVEGYGNFLCGKSLALKD